MWCGEPGPSSAGGQSWLLASSSQALQIGLRAAYHHFAALVSLPGEKSVGAKERLRLLEGLLVTVAVHDLVPIVLVLVVVVWRHHGDDLAEEVAFVEVLEDFGAPSQDDGWQPRLRWSSFSSWASIAPLLGGQS